MIFVLGKRAERSEKGGTVDWLSPPAWAKALLNPLWGICNVERYVSYTSITTTLRSGDSNCWRLLIVSAANRKTVQDAGHFSLRMPSTQSHYSLIPMPPIFQYSVVPSPLPWTSPKPARKDKLPSPLRTYQQAQVADASEKATTQESESCVDPTVARCLAPSSTLLNIDSWSICGTRCWCSKKKHVTSHIRALIPCLWA
jgi:hypothetical protein